QYPPTQDPEPYNPQWAPFENTLVGERTVKAIRSKQISLRSPLAGGVTPTILLSLATSWVVLAMAALCIAPAWGQSAPTAAPIIHVDTPHNSLAAAHTADDDATEIAKKLQNPVGDLISVPFTNYTNFNVGPNKGTQDILQIQPVIPIHVNE